MPSTHLHKCVNLHHLILDEPSKVITEPVWNRPTMGQPRTQRNNTFPHIKHHPINRSKNVGPKPYIYIFKTILGGSFTELNPKDLYYIFNYHYDILGIFGAVEYKTYGLFGTSSKFFSKKILELIGHFNFDDLVGTPMT